MIVVAIIATVTALVVPEIVVALERAKVNRAIADIRAIESELIAYLAGAGDLPHDLNELATVRHVDPWGQPYRYLKILNNEREARGKWRKDLFLVPINSDFDLYSSGPDKTSRSPLTARASRDDIIRAANGGFIGRVSDY